MESNHLIELVNVTKEYSGEKALDNINLYIRNGEFLTLLGPSGCGKTTMLRIISGFTMPTNGDVYLDGKRVNEVPPYKRRVNTVFQKYALFTHLNVFDNVAFGLKLKKVGKKEIQRRVESILELVNLKGYERRWIDQLSGGQQQRVAIARALVNDPEVLLLDEPLSALDKKLRKDMQVELKRMQQAVGITFVYVTHDQEEALTMSDTVVVMNEGKIQQIGTPQDIYNEPKNKFVAQFIGESNIIDGVMLQDYLVSFKGSAYQCVDTGFEPNEPVDVVIRPEDVDIVPLGSAPLTGVITDVVFMGVHYAITVNCNEFSLMVHTTDYVPVGEHVSVQILPDAIHVMKKPKTLDESEAIEATQEMKAIEEGMDAEEQ